MDHDLHWGVTVGKDIKKIGWGDEIESWESHSLGVHELVKCFLANCQFSLNLLESWENGFLGTETQAFLVLETICEDVSNLLIDINELDRFLWKLFLYFLGVNEEVFQEGPGSLDLTYDNSDFTDGGKSLLPVNDLVLECGEVS